MFIRGIAAVSAGQGWGRHKTGADDGRAVRRPGSGQFVTVRHQVTERTVSATGDKFQMKSPGGATGIRGLCGANQCCVVLVEQFFEQAGYGLVALSLFRMRHALHGLRRLFHRRSRCRSCCCIRLSHRAVESMALLAGWTVATSGNAVASRLKLSVLVRGSAREAIR